VITLNLLGTKGASWWRLLVAAVRSGTKKARKLMRLARGQA
jgi:hypothetical protein